MSDSTKEEFLAEGVRRYSQALDTIQAFTTMLSDRLREVVRDYSCKVFTPSSTSIKTGGAFTNVIWAAQEGSLRSRKGTVELELGIRWQGNEVAYYCGFLDEANKAVDFEYTRNHPRIEFRKWSRKARLFMLVEPGKEIALDEEFKIILDELTGSFK